MTLLWYASPHQPFLGYQSSNVVGHKPQLFLRSRTRRAVTAERSSTSGSGRELEDRIREQLVNAELSPSSYDTAWAAMVPAPGSPLASRFPQCVDWILQNQRSDGSWGLGCGEDQASLGKDAVSSTLACVLALRTWGVGEEHVGKGLRFIGHNSSFVTDDKCDTPAGFNVIFPGMLERGIGMGLEIPLAHADVHAILRLRDTELKSMASGSKAAYMAYIAEGLGNLLDWDQAMAYQRKNGSFFDSPATTAAAAIHSYNGRAVDYLDLLITKSGSSSVPAVYPRNVYNQLRMVDTLEKMGISPSFSYEIHNILDTTYSSWLAKDDEIMLDMATCAMAFRLLRMHGYDVSSDGLSQFSEESSFHDSIQGHLNDTEALLQLYKASQVQILEEELILENIFSWSRKLLRQQQCSNKISTCVDPAEVEHVLKFPSYATLDRLEHRRNIQHFKTGGFQMLKSAFRVSHADEEIVTLATNGFHSSQAVYQQEIEQLNRWVKEVRLPELEFARVLPLPILFSAAATMFPAQLSEARIAWSMSSVLTTIVDDLFDTGESMEELENLVTLFDLWDAHQEAGFYSERVEIVFRAVYDTCKHLVGKAASVQNRSVMDHIAELWVDIVRAMMSEAEWRMSGRVPSVEEYLPIGEVSFAIGPIVPVAAYFVGPELPEDVVRCPEYEEMLSLVNLSGRLLNDLQTYQREKKQGKTNSVLLLADPSYGGSIEAAKKEVKSIIEASRRKLLRLVLREGAAVPRPARQLFWNMSKVLHL
ncbi:dolabradiene synthase KSL4, chloroplastic-like, partial [Miscanthus floridulus]